jgi:hypothetical protein
MGNDEWRCLRSSGAANAQLTPASFNDLSSLTATDRSCQYQRYNAQSCVASIKLKNGVYIVMRIYPYCP